MACRCVAPVGTICLVEATSPSIPRPYGRLSADRYILVISVLTSRNDRSALPIVTMHKVKDGRSKNGGFGSNAFTKSKSHTGLGLTPSKANSHSVISYRGSAANLCITVQTENCWNDIKLRSLKLLYRIVVKRIVVKRRWRGKRFFSLWQVLFKKVCCDTVLARTMCPAHSSHDGCFWQSLHSGCVML